MLSNGYSTFRLCLNLQIESQQKGGSSGSSSEDSGHNSPEPKNEIQKVRASLKNKGSFSQKLTSN